MMTVLSKNTGNVDLFNSETICKTVFFSRETLQFNTDTTVSRSLSSSLSSSPSSLCFIFVVADVDVVSVIFFDGVEGVL